MVEVAEAVVEEAQEQNIAMDPVIAIVEEMKTQVVAVVQLVEVFLVAVEVVEVVEVVEAMMLVEEEGISFFSWTLL
jgi:hypothetical protein